MYSVGIDIGYSSIKITLVSNDSEIKYSKYLLHKGRVKEVLINAINDLLENFNSDDIEIGAVTGSGSKFLTKANEVTFVNEVAAIVEGSIATNENIGSIIEIGGESAKYITGFTKNDKSKIEISMNPNCSAGTGSFLEEQMSRLGLRLEDYSLYASKAKSIPRIAGRCSVFAKTDITHHQQEGTAVEDILLGLAYAVIRNYKGVVMKKLPVIKPIMFVGGVAHNQGVITALEDVLNLAEGELIIPEHFGTAGACGAAIMGRNDNLKINLLALLNNLEQMKEVYENDDDELKLPKLTSFGEDDSIGKHECKILEESNCRIECYLGIDVGSTSTNLVLIDKENHIISHEYLRTLGNPIEAVKLGLKKIKEEFGEKINIIGVGTTGSGRYMLGELVGADVVKDEITAQAKAAVTIDYSVDTIFEIGGQDSKYIGIENGVVTDFQMNKICAAGTGSFIEEQAKKFNIPIKDFGRIALESKNPINLGERCTVFIETSIATNLSRGRKLEDIASGLCYSIVKNYIDKVVGQKKVGEKIFLQGGVAYNQGIVNAFKAITGKEIIVPPFFSVTGAYGAAILTKEEIGDKKTRFKGFDIDTREQYINKKREDKADNKSIYDEKTRNLIFKDYDSSIDSKKKTIGIPRALFTYGMFPMFYALFKELGFNVVLSDPTDEKTIGLGQQYALDETCYPVKLITGHVAELVEKKVDYIFFPNLNTVDHPSSKSRKNYGCPYMQLAYKVMNQSMELEKKGIKLLSPTFAFNLGKEFMMKSFSELGKTLNKTPEQTMKALEKGMEAFKRHEKRLKENSKEVIKELKSNEKVFVIISKIYGVADPILNMGIPSKLMDMGYKVLSFYDMPEVDIFKGHPNMYWPFGQHILEPTQIIKAHPNLYAILLTHHGCGPDSVISHYFREEMNGKPYLHIEIDEHSSGVGIITRVEAFINSLKNIETKEADDMEEYLKKIVCKNVNIKSNLNEIDDELVIYLPYMYPYSQIYKEILSSEGRCAKVLPITSNSSIEIGRKFTITEEYFSLTALLGDCFKEIYEQKNNDEKIAFLIPQNEGAEVDGQYNRILRTKLDEEGFKNIDVISPFVEDMLDKNEEDVKLISLGLLAGDIIRIAHNKTREKHLDDIIQLIKNDCFDLKNLKEKANEIREELKNVKFKKKVFVTGEFAILYNDFLNNYIFRDLENKGNKVIYSSFSEAIWMIWRDYLDQNKNKNSSINKEKLDKFKDNIYEISRCFENESPFCIV